MLKELVRYLREGKRQEQTLPPNEMAVAVREAALDLLHFGTTGSHDPIAEWYQPETIQIHTLLRYTPETNRNLQTFQQVLRSPVDFKIVDQPESLWEKDTPDGNVLHLTDNGDNRYEVANYMTHAFLNRLLGTDDGMKQDNYTIGLTRKSDGVWSAHFGFSPAYTSEELATIEDTDEGYGFLRKATGSLAQGVYPEQRLLLNFVFSPGPLDATLVIEHFFDPPFARYLTAGNKRNVYGFETQTLEFHAGDLVQEFQSDETDYREGFALPHLSLLIYALNKDGDRPFSLVKLGRREIGNQMYHIYSVAEGTVPIKAPLEKRESAPTLSFSPM